MVIAKRWLDWLAGGEYRWLMVIIAITLAIHFSIINHPGETVFDEVYYVGDARHILAGDAQLRGEHPPLGELFIVAGMSLFGDDPFGWRFFPVVFGTASIFLIYLICRRLNLSRNISLLATFFFAFENQSFIQASVAMLDVFTVTFALAAFLCYLRGNYVLAGVAIALSTLAKLSGALILPAITLHWLVSRRDRPVYFGASMVLAPLLFVELLPFFDLAIIRQLTDPLSRIKQMLTLSGSVTFSSVTHPFATRPWEWLIYPLMMPYWYEPHYTATISFTVWAFIIPATGYLVYRAKRGSEAAIFALCWFAGTYLLWIPLSLVSDRVTYPYYFYPTIGAVCIGIALGLSRLFELRRGGGKLGWLAKIAILVVLVLHLGVFLTLSPLVPWWYYSIFPPGG